MLNQWTFGLFKHDSSKEERDLNKSATAEESLPANPTITISQLTEPVQVTSLSKLSSQQVAPPADGTLSDAAFANHAGATSTLTTKYVDDEIPVECQHCRQLVSSRFLDEHELTCADHLTKTELRKMQEIPNTKVKSTEINKIRSHSSDNDEDFTTFERTPSRNKVVHQVSGSNSSLKLNGASPFGLKGMVKMHSQKQPNIERPKLNKSRGTGGLELTKLLASD